MKFTKPDPSIDTTPPITIKFEHSGNEHRLVVSNSHKHIKNSEVKQLLKLEGWDVYEAMSDAYYVGDKSSSLETFEKVAGELEEVYGIVKAQDQVDDHIWVRTSNDQSID